MNRSLAQLSAHDVAAVQMDGPREITVHFADAGHVRCNRFWLRDNFPSNGDRASLFRPFSAAWLGDDLAIVDAALHDGGVRIDFSDGASGVFPGSLLRDCVGPSTDGRGWVPWRAGDEPTSVTFDSALEGSIHHHRLLDALDRRGFAVVMGVSNEPRATETMASWLGPIRETDFGRVFDIVTEPDPFTPSQSESALDPHTDDPYRYSPAGVSILHCLTPCSGTGGASTIVDGFAVADAVAAHDPLAFELLTSVPIPYIHQRARSVDQGAAVDLRASGPVISLDANGDICGIRFHERAMARLRLDPDVVDDVYRALALFSRLACAGDFAYDRRLEAGEAIIYDNQRVLHGRSEITGGHSRRHLRLCTVDRDQVHSRLRQLSERYAPGTEHRPLSAGSHS